MHKSHLSTTEWVLSTLTRSVLDNYAKTSSTEYQILLNINETDSNYTHKSFFLKDTGLGTEGSVIWEELGAYDRNMPYDAFKELNFYKG